MNKVILTGRLTKDPVIAETPNKVCVCKFTLAVQRRFKNENGESEADFINIVAWRGLAENCYKYLKKGSKCGVIGELQTRTFDAQDGTKYYVTEVLADEIEFLSEKQNEQKETAPIQDDNLPF